MEDIEKRFYDIYKQLDELNYSLLGNQELSSCIRESIYAFFIHAYAVHKLIEESEF